MPGLAPSDTGSVPRRVTGRDRRLTAGGIVLLYAAVGIAWIVTSDAIINKVLPIGVVEIVGSVKGIGYVLVTGLGLFGLLLVRDLAIVRGQHELEASEERFRLLAERSQNLIYRYRAEPTPGFEFVNRAAATLTGYAPDEYLADADLFRRLVEPEDRHLLEEILTGRWPEDVPVELRWRRRDGLLLWTEHRFVEIREERAGRSWRWIEGSVRDVTARKEAEADLRVAFEVIREREAAMRAAEARLRAIVDSSPLAIVAVDRTGVVTAWSPAAQAILGFSEAEVVGRPASALITDDPAWVSQGLAEVLAGEVLSRVPVRYRHRDGRFIDLLFFAGPIRDHSGEVTGAVVVAEDITAMQAAEAERIRLLTAIEQAAEAIVLTDAEARIEYVNPAFERLSGYAKAELVGQNPRVLKSGAQDAAFYEAMWTTLRAGEPWRGVLVNRARSGELFEEEATITPVHDERGAIVAYVGVKRDLTRERALEVELARRPRRMLRQGREATRPVTVKGPASRRIAMPRVRGRTGG